ncbi:hypothetical protein E2562_011873 [Oryza meyeriana var. granulata]|uniref:Uncharacterized protein n=1 Tax=Oryza meyeriana var. granulata TaxID=110450 RepID=A0A6G1CE84_9ORYZ|nr:hypothetical protein E2562_011873 [Oryza meyeriana var. granulata]
MSIPASGVFEPSPHTHLHGGGVKVSGQRIGASSSPRSHGGGGYGAERGFSWMERGTKGSELEWETIEEAATAASAEAFLLPDSLHHWNDPSAAVLPPPSQARNHRFRGSFRDALRVANAE